MRELNPNVLHVTYSGDIEVNHFSLPRRYTLTHSDRTGHMFLGIGRQFSKKQISGFYTRFMRDEVLAEWRQAGENYRLHVFCHVSGGLVFGSARMRLAIFKQHMRWGDREIYSACPGLDGSRVIVHFCSKDPKIDRTQDYGPTSDFS